MRILETPTDESNNPNVEATGPTRRQDGRLVDNQQTILPVADVVLVDAIGTGISRASKADYEPKF